MCSTFCSSRQPSRSSSRCCSSAEPLHVRRAVRLRHADGRLVIFRDQSIRARRAQTRPPPKTVRSPAAGTSCSSRETRSPGSRQMVPLSGGCSPDSTRSRLLLPAPLRPISAIRSPGSIWRSASSKRGRWPKARPIFCNDNRGTADNVPRATCYVLGATCKEHVLRARARARATCSCRVQHDARVRARDPARGTGTSHAARMARCTQHPARSTS